MEDEMLNKRRRAINYVKDSDDINRDDINVEDGPAKNIDFDNRYAAIRMHSCIQ